uniref:C2H2-type domain-containing protein n=1 Tax=Haemonchus contortus TaxID=6289 RepID=A0A7I4YPV3_HAECO
MEGTAAKKARVWNPALENDVIKDKLHSDHDQTSNNTPIHVQPTLNYFHLARAQQQKVVEEAFRRGFTQPFSMPTATMMPRVPAFPAITSPPQSIAPLLPSSSSSSSAAPTTISNNPLVQSALGVVAMTNENCCAICGSAFRLTADLVQHMRNNHRRTRFKRKNEKTFV